MDRTVRVAVVQAETAPDLAGGLERTAKLASEAAGRGATVVAFPETWLPGYPAWLDVCRDAALWEHPPVRSAYARMAEESVTVPGAACDALSGIAAEQGITLVVGVVERIESGPGRGTLYNALLFFGPDGRLLNHHRKVMPTYTERMVWGMGDADGVVGVDTPSGRIGGLICWEHWMPLTRQAMHESGEDIHIAAWPTVKETSLLASRHYAFEGRCYVLAAGSLQRASALPPGLPPDASIVASPDTLVVRGGSAIIAPDATIIAGPVPDEPCILTADLELRRIREESMTLDVGGHYARPDLFSLRRAGAVRTATGTGSTSHGAARP